VLWIFDTNTSMSVDTTRQDTTRHDQTIRFDATRHTTNHHTIIEWCHFPQTNDLPCCVCFFLSMEMDHLSEMGPRHYNTNKTASSLVWSDVMWKECGSMDRHTHTQTPPSIRFRFQQLENMMICSYTGSRSRSRSRSQRQTTQKVSIECFAMLFCRRQFTPMSRVSGWFDDAMVTQIQE